MEAKTADSYEEMTEIFGDIQQWMANDIPKYTLYIERIIGACRTYVHGFRVSASSSFIDFTTLGVPKGARTA